MEPGWALWFLVLAIGLLLARDRAWLAAIGSASVAAGVGTLAFGASSAGAEQLGLLAGWTLSGAIAWIASVRAHEPATALPRGRPVWVAGLLALTLVPAVWSAIAGGDLGSHTLAALALVAIAAVVWTARVSAQSAADRLVRTSASFTSSSSASAK